MHFKKYWHVEEKCWNNKGIDQVNFVSNNSKDEEDREEPPLLFMSDEIDNDVWYLDGSWKITW